MTPLVSIYCSTYNHAAYIRDALDGFVNQATEFPFEVIVHDDASTDGTSQIVREYSNKYSFVKAVIETENQFSQHKSYYYESYLPEVKSKYIAKCEGDDYWIDPHKLQRLTSYLESNQECVACTHDTIVDDLLRKKKYRLSFLSGDQDVTPHDLIAYKSPFHTSSLVFRSSLCKPFPDFIRSVPGIGDYPFRIYLATQGAVHYFDQAMSVYRRGVPGSWTMRRTFDEEKRVQDCNRIIDMLELANEYSDFRFKQDFESAILEQEYNILDARGFYKQMLRYPYRNFLMQRGVKHRLRIIVSAMLGRGISRG